MAEPEPAQLATEVHDVGLGPGARMRAGLDRVLLGGQAEGVEPQRVQTRCVRSSGSTGRRRRWRCSRAGGRRAAPPPTGTGTCPGRTSCRRALRVPSAGASEPTGLGTLNVPEPGPVVLPGALDLAGQLRGVAVLRRVGIRVRGRRSAIQSRQQGISARPSPGAPDPLATGWSRFRCRPIRGSFQLCFSPSARPEQWLRSASMVGLKFDQRPSYSGGIDRDDSYRPHAGEQSQVAWPPAPSESSALAGATASAEPLVPQPAVPGPVPMQPAVQPGAELRGVSGRRQPVRAGAGAGPTAGPPGRCRAGAGSGRSTVPAACPPHGRARRRGAVAARGHARRHRHLRDFLKGKDVKLEPQTARWTSRR